MKDPLKEVRGHQCFKSMVQILTPASPSVLPPFLIFIGVKLIYNVVLVSGVQQSESVIHIHISTLF